MPWNCLYLPLLPSTASWAWRIFPSLPVASLAVGSEEVTLLDRIINEGRIGRDDEQREQSRQQIAKLVEEKKIEGISAIRDESDRDGMRVVFELRKDANAQIVLNQLFKRSSLEINYGIIFLALVNNEPKLLNLKEMLVAFFLDKFS